MIDNMTSSNSTTINASVNLYKSFVAWTKKLHGKDDVTAGELLTGASEHGKGTIDMFDETHYCTPEKNDSSEDSDNGTSARKKSVANNKGIVIKSIFDE